MRCSNAVDTSIAGQGELQAEVKNRCAIIPCQIRDIGGGRSEMTFTPRDINTHLVNVTFNGLPLPGNIFWYFSTCLLFCHIYINTCKMSLTLLFVKVCKKYV